jgi:hypothetical protein
MPHTAPTLDSRFKPNPDVIVTELTDRDGKPEAVLLNIATQKYFSLHLSGIRIWKALEQQLPLSAAAADLVECFDVTEAHAADSVLRLANELADAKLIAIDGEPA